MHSQDDGTKAFHAPIQNHSMTADLYFCNKEKYISLYRRPVVCTLKLLQTLKL